MCFSYSGDQRRLLCAALQSCQMEVYLRYFGKGSFFFPISPLNSQTRYRLAFDRIRFFYVRSRHQMRLLVERGRENKTLNIYWETFQTRTNTILESIGWHLTSGGSVHWGVLEGKG